MPDLTAWTESRKRIAIEKIKLNIMRQDLQIAEMNMRKLDIMESVAQIEENIKVAQAEIQRCQTELADVQKIVIK